MILNLLYLILRGALILGKVGKIIFTFEKGIYLFLEKLHLTNDHQVNHWKRSTKEDVTLNVIDGVVEKLVGGDRCRLEVWRCVSGVMEGGVKFIDKPGGLWR